MNKLMQTIFIKLTKFFSRIRRIPIARNIFDFLYFHIYDYLSGIVLIEVQGHKMYVDLEDTGVVPYLIKDGIYEKYTTEYFKKIVKSGQVVVDVGAMIGYYTLIAAEIVGENGKVFAFEPAVDNYNLLIKNIEENGYKNIVPVQKAVSNKVGTTKLYLAQKNKGDHRIYDTRNGRSHIEVETITLDDFFKDEERIDVIKIDVQGAEYVVLQGMREILRRNSNLKIFVEFWPMGLRRMGYSPEEFLNEFYKCGFMIYLINEEITPIDKDSLLAMCIDEKFVNLLCMKENCNVAEITK